MKIRRSWVVFFTIFCVTLGLVTCSQNTVILNQSNNSNPSQDGGIGVNTNQPKPFTIWWSQGFVTEENEVVYQLVEGWKKATGKEAKLQLIPNDIMLDEIDKAIEKGNPPDVVFSLRGDFNLFPRLAWQNQLTDVSDLILPIKKSFSPTALQAVYYQNNKTQQRSYYAVPIGQNAVHIFYWRDLLAKAGFTDKDIPVNWEDYWQFWQKVQTQLRQKGEKDVYALGLTLGNVGVDTHLAFEHFLEAYGGDILDANGNLLVDRPETRQGLIKALEKYKEFYQQGYIPPKSLDWTDSGNNISYLERESLMTANSTLTIPLTQKQQDNPYNKYSRDLYFNKMVTAIWPNKPDGKPVKSLLAVKQVVIFAASKHQEESKSFVSYLLKPENLNLFLKEGNKGRFIPVMPTLLQDSYWTNTVDPHTPIVVKQINESSRPGNEVYHPAYSTVIAENIWSQTLENMIKKNLSPEQAADQAIAKIKTIFSKWK